MAVLLLLYMLVATLLTPLLDAAPSKAATTDTNFVATFDDLPAALGVLGKGATVPTPYKGLQYTNVTYYSQLVVNFGALAQSKPNVGFVAQDGQTTVATLAAYPASDKPTTFDLNRFYFGCVGLTRVTTATGARKCDIQVTGYKLDPLQPAVKPFKISFKTGGSFPSFSLFNVRMQEAKLPSTFTGLTKVSIAVVPDPSQRGTTDIVFDNVEYTTHEG